MWIYIRRNFKQMSQGFTRDANSNVFSKRLNFQTVTLLCRLFVSTFVNTTAAVRERIKSVVIELSGYIGNAIKFARNGAQDEVYCVGHHVLPHDAMQARPMSSCGVCPCVCHVRTFCQNE